MIGYIYIITNKINGKQYVGKTYSSIQKRFRSHIRDSRRINKTENRPLHRAIRKYGEENFYIELLEECNEKLEEKEIYWIKELKTYRKGYNITFGGEGKPNFKYNDKIVIKKYFQLGTVKETAKFFECDIATIRKRLRGNNVRIESSASISKRNLSKSVKFYNSLENKNIIFNSTMDAARYIREIKKSDGVLRHIAWNISKCCDKRLNTAYGFVWEWL